MPVEGCGAGWAGACCGEERGSVGAVGRFRFGGEEVCGETSKVGKVGARRRRANEGASACSWDGGRAESACLRRNEEGFALLQLRFERGVRDV